MELIRFQFKARIIRILNDGFIAIENNYLIRFHDKKHKHLFNINDNINIVIENVDFAKEESIRKGYSVIYGKLNGFLSNGIQFTDISEQQGFFWGNRGMLTNKKFEDDDIFEKGDILRIMLRNN